MDFSGINGIFNHGIQITCWALNDFETPQPRKPAEKVALAVRMAGIDAQ